MTKKILIIEDNSSVCNLLQNCLTQNGYEIAFATEGGDEGILLAVTESPDLILVDTDLPVIDGWQVIRILKASTVTQNIPVIALTAPATDADWNRVLESGCNACELKPIDPKGILGKIKALTEPIAVDRGADVSTVSTEPDPILFPKYQLSYKAASHMLRRSSALMTTATESQEARVVYVDDSPLDSQTMAAIVEGAGYGYNNISEPLKALPLLLEIKPQLIFLDLVMPDTNGYEMCAQIRRTSVFRSTPIIIVTNNDGIIDRVRTRFVGASGFFSKPVKEERVVKLLNKYLHPAPVSLMENLYQRSILPFV
ncbi:response regulator containing a -like receiver domain protein and a ggdef domain protein [Leptolyngbya sp. Heron Island J]|uniref:response regulator transcription factor n=1 Tax=Leptolyngbya sp. Heron Island J TaxID=1385935 RepID=UPI0003B9CDDD|nr:response regulator [Leptolyngbya sp. Heron Island J]ESA35665.1 response regulator containing a -like receiver domain protein and a ggdef domain protein [Leptolyngbya sp. Heron Island J]